MNIKKRLRLRQFNTWEFNCDECCLKSEKECSGDKEFCAIKYDHTVIREHRARGNKYQGVKADFAEELTSGSADANQTEKLTSVKVNEPKNDCNKPVEPSELCGQGRCWECPRTLC